jgi:benzodiazapine receptor
MSDVAKLSARRSAVALTAFVGLCLIVAGVGGAATVSSVHSWYPHLRKPSFNPPDWVFGPIWTVLYILMAVAAWRVWRRQARGRSIALALWGFQLTLNLGWSLIFFGLHAPAAALAELALLLAAVAASVIAFAQQDALGALLLIPYLCWSSFAFLLNFEIWKLN